MTIENKTIQEAYLSMYGNTEIISESVHADIQSIMDSDTNPKYKLGEVTKKARKLIASGEDTGMESDKPKKGSSRAVFFPKDHKEVTIDGVKTKAPTAVKIAFPGTLDKHHGEDTLMGEDQNRIEADHYINSNYGIIHHHSDHDKRGEYESSDHESGGVLAPVFDSHKDDHYIEMGRAEKVNAKNISEATKTKEFPKGLSHQEIYDAMNRNHAMAHGTRPNQKSKYSDDHLDKVSEHPWVEHATSMMYDSDMHPGDLVKDNLGIYTHPVTGKTHLAIIDYGWSNRIAKKYNKARDNMYKLQRWY